MTDVLLSPIQRAIAIVGSQQKLVEAIGGIRSQTTISRIVAGQAPMAPGVAKAIEAATDYRVRRWELAPDVWDPPYLVKPTATARASSDSCL